MSSYRPIKTRGWFNTLLDGAGFDTSKPLVDPPAGEKMDIPGSGRIWLRAMKDVEEAGQDDYFRAAACVASSGCTAVFNAIGEEVRAAMFIDGHFYLEFVDENQIERWLPMDETVELRDAFDRGETPPKRFMLRFRAAEGTERLEHRRRTRAKSKRTNGGRANGNGRPASRRRHLALNTEIRNGVLIAQRIKADRAATKEASA